jgi:hypothetical protein
MYAGVTMRKVFALLFVVFGASLALFSPARAQTQSQNRNTITGFIFDEDRRPVSEVYVELQSENYSLVSRTQTRGSGMFTFTGLAPGQYYVKVLNGGKDFEEQVRLVSLVPLSSVQGRGIAQEHVDINLKKRKAPGSDVVKKSPGVIFAQQPPAEAKQLYEDGILDLDLKKDAQGLDKIKRSLEVYPDYFVALERLGTEYVTRGHYVAAFVLLTKALQVNSRSFSSALALGVAEYRLGATDEAIGHFKQAVDLEKTSTNAHLWLGIALLSKSRHGEALLSLLEANRLSGGTLAEAHWQLARVYKEQKKYVLAADELELFLKYSPEAKDAASIRQVIDSLRSKKA